LDQEFLIQVKTKLFKLFKNQFAITLSECQIKS